MQTNLLEDWKPVVEKNGRPYVISISTAKELLQLSKVVMRGRNITTGRKVLTSPIIDIRENSEESEKVEVLSSLKGASKGNFNITYYLLANFEDVEKKLTLLQQMEATLMVATELMNSKTLYYFLEKEQDKFFEMVLKKFILSLNSPLILNSEKLTFVSACDVTKDAEKREVLKEIQSFEVETRSTILNFINNYGII